MIVEEIQGNIANLSNSEKQKHVEKVYLENSDLVKRIQRVVTDHGTEIGIRLKQPIDLQYGDILYADDHNMIIVDVNSEGSFSDSTKNIARNGRYSPSIRKSSFASTIYRD